MLLRCCHYPVARQPSRHVLCLRYLLQAWSLGVDERVGRTVPQSSDRQLPSTHSTDRNLRAQVVGPNLMAFECRVACTISHTSHTHLELETVKSAQGLQAFVRSSGARPLLLCFHSPSCSPSQQLLSKLEKCDYDVTPEQLHVVTVNIDDEGLKMIRGKFNVKKTPTIISIFGGAVLDVRDGTMEDADLQAFLRSIVKATTR
eukprot:jgi/Ulvmu1/4139/UM019_0118.1